MSIRVRGTIIITRRSSRNGGFNVGELSTEIGSFEVKDQLIEEYEPGKYAGEFLIAWIGPDSFIWQGKVFVKIRATLEAVFIDQDEGEAPAPATPPEPDPIETAATAIAKAKASAGDEPAPTPSATTTLTPTLTRTAAGADDQALPQPKPLATSEQSEDGRLFGAELLDLVLARKVIKLDPTVDRQVFRHQRDRLKELGFVFNATGQTWAPRDLVADDIPF